jgi:hypothetical protein
LFEKPGVKTPGFFMMGGHAKRVARIHPIIPAIRLSKL